MTRPNELAAVRAGGWSLILAAIACVVALVAPASAAPYDPAAAYAPRVTAFLTQRPDPARTARVANVTLKRDAARLTLESGTLTLCTPVDGRVCAAVFTGAGTFTMTPPTAFEQRELARFLKATTVTRRIKAMVLFFADGTVGELERSLTFAPGRDAGAADRLAWAIEALGERKSLSLDPPIAQPLLDGVESGYFHASIVCDDDERLQFEVDPKQFEEVSLWRVYGGPYLTAAESKDREIVTLFPSMGRYDTLATGFFRPDIAVTRYQIASRISSVVAFSSVARMACRVERDGVRWVPLQLYEDLEVDSVTWGDGTPVAFHKGRKESDLWVRLPKAGIRGETFDLRVVHHGELIHTAGDWLSLRSTVNWYPRPRSRTTATFELSYEHPSEFLLASVGEKASETRRGKMTRSAWVLRRPTGNATFVIGRFRAMPFGRDDTPPVEALMYEGTPDRVVWKVGDMEIFGGSKMEPWVPQDVARCVAFYQQLLGPAQVPGFVVAQIPSLHGEAFPGVLNIPETSFDGPTALAQDQVFRSHEVAHQWWGYSVDGRTYHDHWLTEGFANYSALWYLQAGLARPKDYLAVLGAWREHLLADRATRPERGRQPGPIWLGYRNATRSRPSDYVLVDYEKGAWVLHMLRSLLLDLDTMDDGRFVKLMQAFYREHAGGSASTEDFRRIAERHAGEDLGWFFEQWVYGTGIPTYRFAHKIEPADRGQYRVRVRVAQSGVPPEFTMPVTLRVEFGNDRFAWVRRTITGATSEFELPLMPEKPTNVVFNDVESALCEVKRVDW